MAIPNVPHGVIPFVRQPASCLSYIPHHIQRFSASVPDGLTPPIIGD
jgi:hypothetical protein